MEFLNEQILFIMLIPLLILMILIVTNKDSIDRVFDKDILDRLLAHNRTLSKGARNTLFFMALIFMIIALARPVKLKQEIKIDQVGTSVVIALDISKSMQAEDVYPNRLNVAKKKIIEFLKLNRDNKVALIAFANDSFLVTPLTSDIDSVIYLLKNLDTDSITQGGTNILSALETTQRVLKDYTQKNLVIFSDGSDSNEFEKEIEYLKEHNIKVYISNIGTSSPTPIKENDGFLKDMSDNIVLVKRNDSIKALAKASKGVFTTYSLNSSDISAISKDISKNSKKSKFSKESIKDYYELFYIPLSIGLAMLFMAFSSIPNRKTIATLIVTLMSIYPTDSSAFLLDFIDIKEANRLYSEGKYKEASIMYEKISKSNNSNELHNNLANSYYKSAEYDKAISEYNKIVTTDSTKEAKKLYNIANSYVKKNELKKALELYEKSLKLNEDEDTKYNIDEIKKHLQENQNKDQKNQKQKEQNRDKKSSKKNQNTNSNDKQNAQKQDKQQKGADKKVDKTQMSDKEEKRWLKELDKNQKTYMYRVPTTPQKPTNKYW